MVSQVEKNSIAPTHRLNDFQALASLLFLNTRRQKYKYKYKIKTLRLSSIKTIIHSFLLAQALEA
jgi:hypothetical protein